MVLRNVPNDVTCFRTAVRIQTRISSFRECNHRKALWPSPRGLAAVWLQARERRISVVCRIPIWLKKISAGAADIRSCAAVHCCFDRLWRCQKVAILRKVERSEPLTFQELCGTPLVARWSVRKHHSLIHTSGFIALLSAPVEHLPVEHHSSLRQADTAPQLLKAWVGAEVVNPQVSFEEPRNIRGSLLIGFSTNSNALFLSPSPAYIVAIM